MIKPLTLPIMTAFWMAQAVSTHGQSLQPRIDELAAGMDDFAPSVTELPLDEIADDFGDPQDDVAPAQAAADPAVQPKPEPEPAAPVAAATLIPDGWNKHSLLGVTFAVPADWDQMSKPDDDDELAFGSVNMAEKRAIVVALESQPSSRIGDFESEMEELPESASKDFGIDLTGAVTEITYPDPIVAPDGQQLLRKKFVLRKGDHFVYAQIFYRADYKETRSTDALMLMSVNLPESEVTPLIEQLVGTIGLDAAPEPEAQVGVDGLVNYEMPPPTGWMIQYNGSDAINFMTTPSFSASFGVNVGYRARVSWDNDSEFESEPTIVQTEILGHSATLKQGVMKEAQLQVGYSMVKGVRSVYLLDMCLANGEQIVVGQYATESWLESKGYDSLLATISLTLPADAIPCPTETAIAPQPETTTASGWTTYTNDRFGTSAHYPTSHFQPVDTSPENGDGRSFTSADGQAELLIWGGHNALQQTPRQMADDVRANHATATIIDQDVRANGFSIKLQDGTMVLQQNTILDPNDVVHNIRVRYPAAQEANYGVVAQAMIDSLTALGGPAEQTANQTQTKPVASAPPKAPDRVSFGTTGTGQWKGEFVTLINPGPDGSSVKGELEAIALGDGENGYFLAPDTVLGDWRGTEALQLVLRIKSGNGSYYNPYTDGGRGDLFLQSNDMSASIEFDHPVGTDWTIQTVSFDDPRWRVSGAPSVHSLLANVTRFDVRAEYLNGDTRAAMASIDWIPANSKAAPTDVDGTADMEQAFWNSIQSLAQVEGFEAYLEQFPNGVHAAAARQRIAELTPTAPSTDPQIELAFWQSVQSSSDPAMFQAYLDQWPNGTFAVLARLNLKRLTAAPATPNPQPAPQAQPAPTPRAYYTPARKTAERSAIMDAARVPMLQELGQRVIFLVSTLRTDGEWCFLMAEPLQPDGTKLNWYSTPYANDWANDAMSDLVMVLMRRQGNGWQVVDYVIGPTDVHWYNWIDAYGLSERLFTSG